MIVDNLLGLTVVFWWCRWSLVGWWGEKEERETAFDTFLLGGEEGGRDKGTFSVGCDRMIEAYSLIDSDFLVWMYCRFGVFLLYFVYFVYFLSHFVTFDAFDALFIPQTQLNSHRSRIRIDGGVLVVARQGWAEHVGFGRGGGVYFVCISCLCVCVCMESVYLCACAFVSTFVRS